jgi:ankyrin repeat protein
MSRDAQGNSVLHIAASNGSSWMCWKLLEHGGSHLLHDSNVDGCTPLDLAKRGTSAK